MQRWKRDAERVEPCNKLRYPYRGMARKALRHFRSGMLFWDADAHHPYGGLLLQAYRCRTCEGWHLGNQYERREQAVEQLQRRRKRRKALQRERLLQEDNDGN